MTATMGKAVSEAGIQGLPGRLPDGERLLWQGSPEMKSLLRNAFHIRAMAVYFGGILAWCAAVVINHGLSAHAIQVGLMHRAALACVPFALVLIYAWAIQRSTVYSITSRRVVISFGMALPVTFNVPFSRIEAAALHLHRGGSGDITLRLLPGEKMSYFVIWPHARPWRMARTEPMLRCVPDAAAASSILAAALAEHEASADGKVVRLRPVRMPSGAGPRSRVVAAE